MTNTSTDSTLTQRAPSRVRRNRNWPLIVGAVLVAGLVLFSLYGAFIANTKGAYVGSARPFMVPAWVAANPAVGFFANDGKHFLGTDGQGRDMVAVLLAGTPRSLVVGAFGALVGIFIGLAFGLTAGYFGGWVDNVLGIANDVMLSIPGLAVLVVISSYLTQLDLLQLGAIMALFAWPGPARMIRAQVLTLRERPYVDVARLSGSSATRIMWTEILPNMVPFVAVAFTQSMSGIILAVTGLEALGLAQSRLPSLGSAISNALEGSALFRGIWWWWAPPVVLLVLVFIGLFALTIGLDRYADPRLKDAR